jgi:hypothetical protein
MKEEWRPVIGVRHIIDGAYEVSNIGRVRRALAGKGTWVGRLLKCHPHHSGYLIVRLCTGNYSITVDVHCLVAAAFIGPRPSEMTVNHKNGVKHENSATNLEYLSNTENIQHGVKNGLFANCSRRGEENANSKLNELQVAEIRKAYARGFRAGLLAMKYGVHRSQIWSIAHGKSWK